MWSEPHCLGSSMLTSPAQVFVPPLRGSQMTSNMLGEEKSGEGPNCMTSYLKDQ